MKNKLLSVSRIIFVTIIGLVIFAGLFRTLLIPKDINYYENRKANRIPELTVSGFLSSDFQDKTDAAFSDQIFKAERAKEIYNEHETSLTLSIMRRLYQSNPDIYLKFNSLHVFGGDYLLYLAKPLEAVSQSIADKADNLNSITNTHPELDFFSYYIEKETDINFQTGDKPELYSFLCSHLDAQNNSFSVFEIDSFETFSEYFYKTDHHWNHKGSYKAYTELVEHMNLGKPLEYEEEYLVGNNMSGSKAALTKSAGIWTEPMYAYRFDFPEMLITENGERVPDYGVQNSNLELPAYGLYYGSDSGEIIFDTGADEKDNILIIGESYDNALLKLLATHFNRTHSIDLRNYEHFMGKKFNFNEYVEENGITKVLFIGNLDFYTSNAFIVE